MKSAQRFPTDSISIIQEALTVIPNTDGLKNSWNILNPDRLMLDLPELLLSSMKIDHSTLFFNRATS